MAIERRNPLPAGKYWVDVFGPDSSAFVAWISSNSPNVRINTTEGNPNDERGSWVLFTVFSPVSWQGPGYPTIAGPEIKTRSDTSERPPPEKEPSLDDVIDKVGFNSAKLVLIGLGAVLAIKLFKK